MCRLFGALSDKPINVDYYLTKANRSFKSFGNNNKDGWGIGWYENNNAMLYKEEIPVLNSDQFSIKAKATKSDVIICHIRKKSKVKPDKKNSHPFKYYNYLFAHNGYIDGKKIMEILKSKNNQLPSLITGETDSEVYFYWLLHNIMKHDDPIEGIQCAVRKIIEFDYTGLNFLFSDGQTLYAFKYSNKKEHTLYYLINPIYKDNLNNDAKDVTLNRQSDNNKSLESILFCSEKLTDEGWIEIDSSNLVIAKANQPLRIEKII
jgi:predicted glutamine amidotransferase